MDDAGTCELPDDVEALKAIVARVLRERDEIVASAKARMDTVQAQMAAMEAELFRLRKMLYGPRADRLSSPRDLAQMLLDFAAELESRPVVAEDIPDDCRREDAASIRQVRRGRRRIADFDKLPATVIEHDLPEEEKSCPCCGERRKRIGSDESWQIEFVPARFERYRHLRHKYACPKCDANGNGGQVAIAERAAATSAVDKGMAGPGLLAYIVTSKYADFLPLYRLEDIFRRAGFEISRGTQCVWCRDVAEIARPLHDLMCSRVRRSRVIGTDDTVMPMQERERARKARMWVYLGDEDHPYNVFDFTPTRSRDGPARFLADYKGTLLADAYGGYDGVVAGNGITRAGCWAHARRKFVDAECSDPETAAQAVGMIDRLFAIERRISPQKLEIRAATRADESHRVLQLIHSRLLEWKTTLLPKHPMGGAVRYALNQWNELTAFVRDPRVPLDNNASEREMKRMALNRKNSLFVGNTRGGETAAILSSLTSSCRRHGVNPQLYLAQLLVNLPGTPLSRVHEWLPDEWKRRQPTAP